MSSCVEKAVGVAIIYVTIGIAIPSERIQSARLIEPLEADALLSESSTDLDGESRVLIDSCVAFLVGTWHRPTLDVADGSFDLTEFQIGRAHV